MKRLSQKLLMGTLLAAMGMASMAQSNPAPAAGPAAHEARGMTPRMERGDHERLQKRMSERFARHLESLKPKLQLSADQQNAWTTFSNAMQAPAVRPKRMEQSELATLSTPERIDLMRTRMAERDEMLRQRGDATKAFYATLNATQKTIFDKETLPRQRHGQAHRP